MKTSKKRNNFSMRMRHLLVCSSMHMSNLKLECGGGGEPKKTVKNKIIRVGVGVFFFLFEKYKKKIKGGGGGGGGIRNKLVNM